MTKQKVVKVVVELKAEFVREVKKRGLGPFEDEMKRAAMAYEQARAKFAGPAVKEFTPEYDTTLEAANEAFLTLKAAAASYGFARHLNEKKVV